MSDNSDVVIDHLIDVTLDDKYDLSKKTIFLSGTQAILRLTLMQKNVIRPQG